MNTICRFALGVSLLLSAEGAEGAYPSLTLESGSMKALVYLPDGEKGFYRSSRYDPSGIVARVAVGRHVFYTNFLPIHDPLDSAGGAGLTEEFREPVGYEEAAPGGAFIKVGIGLVERRSGGYSFGANLRVLSNAPWTVEHSRNRARFTQRLSALGYGYEYEKTITLDAKAASLRLDHRLRNTGAKRLVTDHYNHHFTLIDDEPVGPSYAASFNFYHVAPSPDKNFLRVEGNVVRMVAALATNQPFMMRPRGFSNARGNPVSVVHNGRTRAGVRIEAQYPVSAFVTYIDSRTLSPEAFYRIDLKPGEECRWATTCTYFEGPFPIPPLKDLDALAFHGIEEIRMDGVPFAGFDGQKTNFIVLLDDATRVPRFEATCMNAADRATVSAPGGVPGKALVSFSCADVRVRPPVYVFDLRTTSIRVTATSNLPDVGPRNTLDGDPDTRWSSEGDGAWIAYDLGSVKNLAGIAIAWYNGDKRKSFYDLSVSLDGANWRKLYAAESSGKGTALETNRFASPVKARHVKYTGYGNSVSKWNSVLDVEFLEK
ncbi:MAG: discoidin domain-containing protein [Spirochaetes bacterium]|nr:discoidin domain-containing protein [Spirochaetota bacterium]